MKVGDKVKIINGAYIGWIGEIHTININTYSVYIGGAKVYAYPYHEDVILFNDNEIYLDDTVQVIDKESPFYGLIGKVI